MNGQGDWAVPAGGGAGTSFRRVEHKYTLTRDGNNTDLDVSAEITEGDTVLVGIFTLRTLDTVSGQWAYIYRYGGSINYPTVYGKHQVANIYQSHNFSIELPSDKLTYRMDAGLSNSDLFFLGYLYT